MRLFLVTLGAAAGLVVFTQVPAVACSCAGGGTAQYVEGADVVFVGTLVEVEQTNPGGDGVVSSGDPVFYAFDVDETFKGDAGRGVVESVRDGATCGLEGMRIDVSYVVFAGASPAGELDASLCGGTSRATTRLIGDVEAALSPATEPPTPAATDLPQPAEPVPTQVPSGVEPSTPADGTPAWAWLSGGLLVAGLVGAVLRPGWR